LDSALKSIEKRQPIPESNQPESKPNSSSTDSTEKIDMSSILGKRKPVIIPDESEQVSKRKAAKVPRATRQQFLTRFQSVLWNKLTKDFVESSQFEALEVNLVSIESKVYQAVENPSEYSNLCRKILSASKAEDVSIEVLEGLIPSPGVKGLSHPETLQTLISHPAPSILEKLSETLPESFVQKNCEESRFDYVKSRVSSIAVNRFRKSIQSSTLECIVSVKVVDKVVIRRADYWKGIKSPVDEMIEVERNKIEHLVDKYVEIEINKQKKVSRESRN
jgi:hypothetical protein